MPHPNPHAETILADADAAICGERAGDYGRAIDNFQTIADLWTGLTGHRLGTGFTPEDVSTLMILVKLARLQTTPDHRDSWLDIAGYAALGYQVTQDMAERAREEGEALDQEQAEADGFSAEFLADFRRVVEHESGTGASPELTPFQRMFGPRAVDLSPEPMPEQGQAPAPRIARMAMLDEDEDGEYGDHHIPVKGTDETVVLRIRAPMLPEQTATMIRALVKHPDIRKSAAYVQQLTIAKNEVGAGPVSGWDDYDRTRLLALVESSVVHGTVLTEQNVGHLDQEVINVLETEL